jgi:hypothetical protein
MHARRRFLADAAPGGVAGSAAFDADIQYQSPVSHRWQILEHVAKRGKV